MQRYTRDLKVISEFLVTLNVSFKVEIWKSLPWYFCIFFASVSNFFWWSTILVLLNLQHIRWGNYLQYEHINNDTNSPALGKCHPYFKVFSRLSKQLPFHLQVPFLPYQTHQWVMNSKCCFLCKSNRNLKTAFQCCSHTYPIHKDMPLTFWFMWVS